MIHLNRRNFLIGANSLLLLPTLESAQVKNSTEPKRLVYLGFGFGLTGDCYPKTFGENYELTRGFAPLSRHKKDITMVANLWHKHSRGPHSGSVNYLRGYGNVSCDQVAEPHMGKNTRFTSLTLSASQSGRAFGDGFGRCNSLSWNEKGQSLSGYRSPLKFFDVLFGGGGRTYEETLRDLEKKKSVLDSFLFSIKSMAKRATKQDKERLGQYYQTIRELEIRIAKEKLWAKEPKPKVKYGRPKDKMNGEEEIKAIYDLIILALQTDSSRVVTYRQPLQRLLTSMGINAIPHDLSHPNGGSPRVQFSRDKDVKQSELLAYFIDKLKDTKDSNGKRLFDSTLVSYGSNLRAGHMLKNVPAIITGNIDNKFKHGRHIEMPVNTPLCNLWLTMLQTAGVPAKSFGDSDGLIEPIFS